MSEEPNTNRDHLRKNSNSNVQADENNLDEISDKIKAGINAMKKKIEKPDEDLLTEYSREKFKEDTKDY
ncbi:MAG: hypothetical protein M3Y25_06675 [Thermoproteota archaeon]|nr:hypothetical protein [Thermoproteota archaeon]